MFEITELLLDAKAKRAKCATRYDRLSDLRVYKDKPT